MRRRRDEAAFAGSPDATKVLGRAYVVREQHGGVGQVAEDLNERIRVDIVTLQISPLLTAVWMGVNTLAPSTGVSSSALMMALPAAEPLL